MPITTKKSNVNGQMSNVAQAIRVRIAPSPTGPFHIGTARTALFNWLFARQNGGKFILRIEDTDRERSSPKWEKEIMEGLLWLGLEWDEGPPSAEQRRQHAELRGKIQRQSASGQRRSAMGQYGPYRQSERGEIYKKYLERLLADGHAYWCYCSKEDLEAERQAMLAQGLAPKYGGHCRMYADSSPLQKVRDGKRPQVIRFKTPEVIVEFKDIIRDTVKFDASLFGDMVIAKNLDTPLFNFAGVVDDAEMKITHVIRGEDHLSNTPKQILLQKALGFRQPEYAHIPLILSPDRSKLSKRFTESSFLDYRDKGYLPEAMMNFLALLGWHPKEDREVLTKDELIKEFDLKRVQKAGAIFNPEKLDWLQKEHLKLLGADKAAERLEPIFKNRGIKTTKAFLKKVLEVEGSRLKTLDELPETALFFFKLPDYEPELLVWQKNSREETITALLGAENIIKKLDAKNFSREILTAALKPLTKELGSGTVLWPLRVAVSGLRASPDPLEIMLVLGKKETEARLKIALDKLRHLK